MSRPSGPTNLFNMSGASVFLFLVVGGLLFGGCAVAIAQAGDIIAAFILIPPLVIALDKWIDYRDERRNRRNAEPEPEPEPVIVERRVGTIYVCRIVHDDGRVQELAAESLPELQRMATRAVGPSARLELGR